MTMRGELFEDAQQNQWGSRPDEEREREERQMEKRQRAQFSGIGLAAAAFMLITVIAQTGMAVFANVMGTIPGGGMNFFKSNSLLFMSAIPMYLIAFPITLAILQGIPECREKPQESWGGGGFLAVLVISLGLGVVGNLMGQAVEYLKPTSNLSGEELGELLGRTSLWINLLVTVVMAPVVEELLFRKLLMDRLMGYGQWAAVLVSGLMFGMAHGNFGQFFYTFGIGLVWAYMYARTGRISLTIGTHMLFNLIGGVFIVEVVKGLEGDVGDFWLLIMLEQAFSVDLSGVVTLISSLLLFVYLLVMFGCVIGTIALLIVFRKKIRFSPGIWPVKKGRMARVVFLNPGMILYFLVCIALFVLSW